MSEPAFVRTEILPKQDPPKSQQGIIGRLREKLFYSIASSIVTVSCPPRLAGWRSSC